MTRRSIMLKLLVLVFVAQWMVPMSLIHRHQATLDDGTAYRFRTAPIDPADPFRGRYVTLDFDAAWLDAGPDPERWNERLQRQAYAPVQVDADGFARLLTPLDAPPAEGDYLRVRISHLHDHRLRVVLPFDRYYLDERLAPEAERLYFAQNRPPRGVEGEVEEIARPAWAVVRIRAGHAVIEELYLDGEPVRERVRRALREAAEN